jgi:hypothetical protein
MCIDFLIIFWQVGVGLIDERPQSQGIVRWRMVDLLSLVLDPINFLMN